MIRRQTAFILFVVGYLVGIACAPALYRMANPAPDLDRVRAEAVMRALACPKKNPREWPIDGKSPCQ